MPANFSFQALTEADLDLLAVRFRALSSVSRLKLMSAAVPGEKLCVMDKVRRRKRSSRVTFHDAE